MDVTARRGVECNTDQHFVRVKLKLKRTPGGKMNRGVKSRWFDVEKLRIRNEKKMAVDEEESVKSTYFQECWREVRTTGVTMQV